MNKYIIDSIITLGVDVNNISLHLHVSEKEITKTENILKYSFFSKIKRFDISLIDTGGCILTMDSKNINKNLTYDILLNSLLKID